MKGCKKCGRKVTTFFGKKGEQGTCAECLNSTPSGTARTIVKLGKIIEESLTVLKEIEWAAKIGPRDGEGPACPICFGFSPEDTLYKDYHQNPGHSLNCRLAAIIKELEEIL